MLILCRKCWAWWAGAYHLHWPQWVILDTSKIQIIRVSQWLRAHVHQSCGGTIKWELQWFKQLLPTLVHLESGCFELTCSASLVRRMWDHPAEGQTWSVTAAQSYPAVPLHPSPKKDMEMKVGFATKSLLLLTSLMAETRESSGSHSYEKNQIFIKTFRAGVTQNMATTSPRSLKDKWPEWIEVIQKALGGVTVLSRWDEGQPPSFLPGYPHVESSLSSR